MADVLFVKTKVKEHLKDVLVSAEYWERLNEKIIQMIDESVERAKANGRKTLKKQDL